MRLVLWRCPRCGAVRPVYVLTSTTPKDGRPRQFSVSGFTSAALWAGVGLCVSNVVGGLYWKREFAQAERSAALGQARGSGADDDVGASLIESRAGSERP